MTTDHVQAQPSIPGVPTWSADHTISPAAGFETSAKWLCQCQDTHEQCSRTGGALPSRVIDVGRKFPIRSVRLYWSEDEEEGQYIGE
jgi:hypothetical protein